MKSAIGVIVAVGIIVAALLFGGMAFLGSTQPKPDTVSRDQLNDWQQTAAWYQAKTAELQQDKATMAERQHALEMQLQSERDNNKTTMALLAAQGQSGTDYAPWAIAGGVLLLGGGLAVAMFRRQPQVQPQQQPIIIQLPQMAQPAQYAQLPDGRIEALEAKVMQIEGGINQVVGYIEAQRAERIQIQRPQSQPLQVTQTKARGQIVGPR
jgi:hypothetical protein